MKKEISLPELLNDFEKKFRDMPDTEEKAFTIEAFNIASNLLQDNSQYPLPLKLDMTHAIQCIFSSCAAYSENGDKMYQKGEGLKKLQDMAKERRRYDVRNFEEKFNKNPKGVLLGEWKDYHLKRINLLRMEDQRSVETRAFNLAVQLVEENFDYPVRLQVKDLKQVDNWIRSSYDFRKGGDQSGKGMKSLENLMERRHKFDEKKFEKKYKKYKKYKKPTDQAGGKFPSSSDPKGIIVVSSEDLPRYLSLLSGGKL